MKLANHNAVLMKSIDYYFFNLIFHSSHHSLQAMSSCEGRANESGPRADTVIDIDIDADAASSTIANKRQKSERESTGSSTNNNSARHTRLFVTWNCNGFTSRAKFNQKELKKVVRRIIQTLFKFKRLDLNRPVIYAVSR